MCHGWCSTVFFKHPSFNPNFKSFLLFAKKKKMSSLDPDYMSLIFFTLASSLSPCFSSVSVWTLWVTENLSKWLQQCYLISGTETTTFIPKQTNKKQKEKQAPHFWFAARLCLPASLAVRWGYLWILSSAQWSMGGSDRSLLEPSPCEAPMYVFPCSFSFQCKREGKATEWKKPGSLDDCVETNYPHWVE